MINGSKKGNRPNGNFGFDPDHHHDIDELPCRKCPVCRKRVHPGTVLCKDGDCKVIFDTFWDLREKNKLPNGVENITEYRNWYMEEKLRATAKLTRNSSSESMFPLAATAT